MGSLISASDKADMESAIMDVFDTFKRPLVVYSAPEKVILSTNPNFSRFGQLDQNVFMPEQEPISRTIEACILYDREQKQPAMIPLNRVDNASQLKLEYPDGRVRIKIKVGDIDLFSNAKLVELDGENFKIDSSARIHGLFGTGLCSFFLNRI